MHYSNHKVVPIKPPIYNRALTRFFRNSGFKLYDLYGIYLGHHELQKFDLIHFMSHPTYREIHLRPRNPKAKYVYRVPGLYSEYKKKGD